MEKKLDELAKSLAANRADCDLCEQKVMHAIQQHQARIDELSRAQHDAGVRLSKLETGAMIMQRVLDEVMDLKRLMLTWGRER